MLVVVVAENVVEPVACANDKKPRVPSGCGEVVNDTVKILLASETVISLVGTCPTFAVTANK